MHVIRDCYCMQIAGENLGRHGWVFWWKHCWFESKALRNAQLCPMRAGSPCPSPRWPMVWIWSSAVPPEQMSIYTQGQQWLPTSGWTYRASACWWSNLCWAASSIHYVQLTYAFHCEALVQYVTWLRHIFQVLLLLLVRLWAARSDYNAFSSISITVSSTLWKKACYLHIVTSSAVVHQSRMGHALYATAKVQTGFLT